jgi:hypothetical protein
MFLRVMRPGSHAGKEQITVAQGSDADLFGTFLDSLQRRDAESAPRSRQAGEDWLLSTLHESGALPVVEVLSLGTSRGLAITEVAMLIEALRTTGLISVDGQPGEGRVALTDRGERVVSAAP